VSACPKQHWTSVYQMPTTKIDGGALHVHCTFWCTVCAVHLVTAELRRFHTKSRSSAPKGALHLQCTKKNTAPKFLKIQPFLVSFTVIKMTLRKNRYQRVTTSLSVCLDTRKCQHNNFSQLPAQPFTPPSSSTTMSDNYNTMLSFGRYLDQHHRRRACPKLVADRAMVLML
jgi:hypothetical protein